MNKNYLDLLLILFFALLLNACDSESDNVDFGGSGNVALTVELEGGGKYNYKGSQSLLKITTTGSWRIEKPVSDNWYSLSSTSGQGNGTIVLSVIKNGDGPRSSIFTISVGTTKKSIEITQDKFDENLLFYPKKEAYRIEIPRLSNDVASNRAAFVVHYAPDKNGDSRLNFSLEYNYATHHSRWVAFTFYDKTAESNTGRTNAWSFDPHLVEWTNNENDYRGSGYDRGHLVASADRLFSKTANEQTFYYSNISPQVNSFNGGIWLELENTLRNEWGRNNSFRDTLYVVKGGTIKDDQVLRTIGTNKVAVPKYNYMAVLSKKGDTYKSIAFWFENRKYDEPYKLKEHALSVEELETLTGIDFFHNLPDNIESVVEKQKGISDWPGL